MENSIPSRLRGLRSSLGLNQRQFAEELGFSAGLVGQIEAGLLQPSRNFLQRLSDSYRVNADWLLYGRGEMLHSSADEITDEAVKILRGALQHVGDDGQHGAAISGGQLKAELRERVLKLLQDDGKELDRLLLGFNPPPPSEFAEVPVHDASVAAGPGHSNPGEEIVGHLAFRRDWLKRIGVAPSDAVIARVAGDSMLPTIHHGDVVLIDTARAAPPTRRRGPKDTRPAPIYALIDDGLARVKRLELVAEGTLALLSDNPATPPEVRPIDRVSIIGRVLWWGHTNRE